MPCLQSALLPTCHFPACNVIRILFRIFHIPYDNNNWMNMWMKSSNCCCWSVDPHTIQTIQIQNTMVVLMTTFTFYPYLNFTTIWSTLSNMSIHNCSKCLLNELYTWTLTWSEMKTELNWSNKSNIENTIITEYPSDAGWLPLNETRILYFLYCSMHFMNINS